VDKERAWKCIDAMRAIGDARGVSVARVALAYVLSKPFVTTVIIGAKTIDQLKDNLEAATLTLNADELKTLDEVSALPPEYPGWMLARQGAERVPQPK
jgi:aryl-alcohol dehydrogenase-like predicted oxidoreductase